jgi:hypothetical protein
VKKVIVFQEDAAREATVESELDVVRTKDSLIIRDVSGSTIEFNWDYVDRFLVTDAEEKQ